MSNTDFYSELNNAKRHLHDMADVISSIKVSDENSLILRGVAEDNVSIAYSILEELLGDENQNVNELIINGVFISRFEGKLFCLNDIHRAGGGKRKHEPYEFLRQKKTKKLIDAIPGEIFEKKYSIKGGGPNRGTFVCREILYAYAMWVDPDFYVKVLSAIHALKPIKWRYE